MAHAKKAAPRKASPKPQAGTNKNRSSARLDRKAGEAPELQPEEVAEALWIVLAYCSPAVGKEIAAARAAYRRLGRRQKEELRALGRQVLNGVAGIYGLFRKGQR